MVHGIATIARCAYDGQSDIVHEIETFDFISKSSLEWEKVPLSKQSSQTNCSNDLMDIEDSANGLHDLMHCMIQHAPQVS